MGVGRLQGVVALTKHMDPWLLAVAQLFVHRGFQELLAVLHGLGERGVPFARMIAGTAGVAGGVRGVDENDTPHGANGVYVRAKDQYRFLLIRLPCFSWAMI